MIGDSGPSLTETSEDGVRRVSGDELLAGLNFLPVDGEGPPDFAFRADALGLWRRRHVEF